MPWSWEERLAPKIKSYDIRIYWSLEYWFIGSNLFCGWWGDIGRIGKYVLLLDVLSRNKLDPINLRVTSYMDDLAYTLDTLTSTAWNISFYQSTVKLPNLEHSTLQNLLNFDCWWFFHEEITVSYTGNS